jgi:hypothetical protein
VGSALKHKDYVRAMGLPLQDEQLSAYPSSGHMAREATGLNSYALSSSYSTTCWQSCMLTIPTCFILTYQKNESVDDVRMAIQESINSWGNLLIAMGGVLQPSKCFYSITSFEWTNREWNYVSNALKGEFGITVPLTGGDNVAISLKLIYYTEKTLGAIIFPDDNSCSAIRMMQEKAQQ